MGVRLVALVILVLLTAPGVLLPRPAAASSYWCSVAWITYAPTGGEGGSKVTMDYTFINNDAADLDVYEFDVQYSWSAATSNLGSILIGGYGSWDFTQSVTLPTAAQTAYIYISVYGQATGDTIADTCIFNPAPLSISQGPVASLTTSTTTGDLPVVASFSASTTGGSGPYTYAWDFGDGSTATGASVSHTFAQTCACTVQVTTKDANGVAANASVLVHVYSQPIVFLIVNRVQESPGVALNFSASASGGSGTYAYVWDFGDGTTGMGASTLHAYNAAGNYTATVNVTDPEGGYVVANRTLSITDLTVKGTESATSVQVGTSISFQASPGGGDGGPYTVLWSFGDGTNGTGTNVSHAYAGTATYYPTVTVRDPSGATSQTRLPAVTVAAASTGGGSTGNGGGSNNGTNPSNGTGPITTPIAVPPARNGVVFYGGIAAIGIAAAVVATLLVRRRRGPKAPPPAAPSPKT